MIVILTCKNPIICHRNKIISISEIFAYFIQIWFKKNAKHNFKSFFLSLSVF